MKRLCFVIPCHKRHALADITLRCLAWTCEELRRYHLDASAILIADDKFFSSLADELGFGYHPSPNQPLGRKWNDGYEYACVDGHADLVVALGSDDIVDPKLIGQHQPDEGQIRCSRLTAVVAPDGRRIAELRIPYHGGDGVRILPAPLLQRVHYRPCIDDRNRAIDGSVSDRLGRKGVTNNAWIYHDVHPLQVVDFKSPHDQITTYEACRDAYQERELDEGLDPLRRHYPGWAVDALRDHYRKHAPRRHRRTP